MVAGMTGFFGNSGGNQSLRVSGREETAVFVSSGLGVASLPCFLRSFN